MDENPYQSPQAPAAQVPPTQRLPRIPHYGLVALGLGGVVFWAMLAVVAYDAITDLHAKVQPATLAEIVAPILAGVAMSIAVIWWAFRRGRAG